jgi:flagellar protein FliT
MDDPKQPACARPVVNGAALSLLDRYQSIAATSRAMVDAARAEDWPEVSRLERLCICQVHQLKRAAQVDSLGPAEQARRVHLLRSILSDDAEIRRLAEPWLIDLEHLLLPGVRPAPRTE